MKRIWSVVGAALVAAATCQVVWAQDAAPTPDAVNAPQAGRSRAEVMAEAAIYLKSGLAAANRVEGVDVWSPAYSQAEARYAQLRGSSDYAGLVQQYAQRRGSRVQ